MIVDDPWTWPPELDEHGAATFAELERIRGRCVAGSYRLRRVPRDDPWYCR